MGDLVNDLLSINNRTTAVSQNYDELLNELRGEFALSLSQKNPALPSVRRSFTATATRLSQKKLLKYKRSLNDSANGLTQSVLSEILTHEQWTKFNSKSEKQLFDYLNECGQSTLMGVYALSQRDIKFGSDQLKTIGFNIMATLANAGIKNAIKGAVIKNMVAGKNYTGSNGKEWRSVVSVRALTRQHLLTVFNEVTLFVGSEMGDTEFVVKTLNQSNPYSDKMISLSDYSEIKEKIFHPNANALIYRKISK